MLRKTGCEPSFRISDEGWAEGAVRCPSTHSDERPAGSPIDLLVIHNISLPPGEFGTGCVRRFFTDRLSVDEHPTFESLRDLHVTSHFLIERTGTVTQFLPCTARGWHAGISSFEGRSRCNDFSIGIEVEGTDFCPFEEAQYAALVRLARAIILRYPIRAVAGHSDIAPGRKTDPGPFFDWSRLAVPEILGCGVSFPFFKACGLTI